MSNPSQILLGIEIGMQIGRIIRDWYSDYQNSNKRKARKARKDEEHVCQTCPFCDQLEND